MSQATIGTNALRAALRQRLLSWFDGDAPEAEKALGMLMLDVVEAAAPAPAPGEPRHKRRDRKAYMANYMRTYRARLKHNDKLS